MKFYLLSFIHPFMRGKSVKSESGAKVVSLKCPNLSGERCSLHLFICISVYPEDLRTQPRYSIQKQRRDPVKRILKITL